MRQTQPRCERFQFGAQFSVADNPESGVRSSGQYLPRALQKNTMSLDGLQPAHDRYHGTTRSDGPA